MRRLSFQMMVPTPKFAISRLLRKSKNLRRQGKKAGILSSLSACSEQNVRPENEDGHVIQKEFRGEDQAFFAVFDGHGGTAVRNFLTGNFVRTFEEILDETAEHGLDNDIRKQFCELFERVETKLEQIYIRHSGATVACCWIKSDSYGNRTVHCANAGDTRVVLARGEEAIPLTVDHTCLEESEIKRMRAAGGLVENGRVEGELAVSRAIGDYKWKQWVISEPYTKSIKLEQGDRFLLIACDGVWDVMSNDEAVEFIDDGVLSGKCTQETAAKYLVDRAISKGSEDNVTALVVYL